MNNTGRKFIALLTPILLLACFIPFLVLCFYCFPAVDDYGYADIATKLGYIGAQVHWYETWTGRYIATALLSFTPALLKAYSLYYFISLLIFLGSLHSIYFLIRSLKLDIARSHIFIMALVALLSYLLFLPDITEAYYWFPGSATYQLATILATYLLGMAIRYESGKFLRNNNLQLLLMCVVAFIVVGSNEVAMAVTLVSVSLYYAVSLLRKKGIFNRRLWLLLITGIGSVLMVFAPGNNLRAENDLTVRSMNHLTNALAVAFNNLTLFISEFWIPILPLIAVSIVFFERQERRRVNWWLLLGTFVMILLLAFAVIFPTYYIGLNEPPLRTQNFCLWILILGSVFIGRLLSPLLRFIPITLVSESSRLHVVTIAFLILIFLLPGYNGTEKAYADLFSGSAQTFKEQYLERPQLLNSCDNNLCIVPAYTAYPYNTFHSDLDTVYGKWWNHLYGDYHGEKTVVVDYDNLKPYYSQTLHFDPSETFLENFNLDNLSDAVSYDSGFSYHLSPSILYGGGVSFSLDTIDTRFGNQPAYLKISGHARFLEATRDIHLVSIVNRPRSGKLINWMSVTWENAIEDSNGWFYTELLIPLYTRDIHGSDKFKIFLWNPNKRDAYVDNLTFTLY